MFKRLFILSIIFVLYTNIGIISKTTLMIGNTIFDGDISKLNTYKLELALRFSCMLKDSTMELIPSTTRDSLIKIYNGNKSNINLIDISKDLNVDYLIFTRVSAIMHLVKTDVTLINVKDTSIHLKGYGYASAKYKNDKGELIYDPSILASLQRALEVAFKDSTMFVDSAKGFTNKPAPLLAIGGIYFANDDKLPEWYLFQKKVVNSFDAVETIFASAIKNNNYITIDTETRDTIYSLNNLYVVENYNAPSEYELLALYRMGVEYYISGVIIRNELGAKLELYLYKFDNGVMQSIASAHEIITEDSIILLRESLKYLTDKILDAKKEKL